MKCFGFFTGLLLLSSLGLAQRQMCPFNDAWAYLENGQVELPEQLPNDGWRPVTLPHTWNQWDATDILPGYRRNASWYKRTLVLSQIPKGQCLLRFEAANTKAWVYVNQQLAGLHIGGYLGFEVDITPFLAPGENSIAVRVDNSYDPELIPSQKADFFIYGGLTRDVWLVQRPKVHLHQLMVQTPVVNSQFAETVARVQLKALTPEKVKGRLHCWLEDTAGQRVAEATLAIDQELSAEHLELRLSTLKSPKLWSPGQPYLYRLQMAYEPDSGQADTLEASVGYRWYRFEPYGAFYLNGERLLLRGTHRHEEHAGYGAAMPNALHRRDMEAIKEMGGNFVRLGHYPQDPEVYKACDELGLIVWDELPWCRGGIGPEAWQVNTRNLLREQILQNYNHPSIFFWSLGNEIYWLPDFPDGGDTTRLNTFLSELHALAHDLDPGRMTAIRKYYAGAGLVDVFSPSIWSGWYAGVYTNYEASLIKERKRYPQFLHMEYGGSSHVGRHTETPVTGDGMLRADAWAETPNQVNIKNIAQQGDWTENYIVDLFDWHLSVSESTDWFGGNAQWAFKDFGTPLRPENAIPYLNQKGLTDRAGHPKDAYYVFKSYWAEKPFAYIESKSWTNRIGPEGQPREICVFSNGGIVELWLNGVSLGQRERQVGNFPANNLRWPVLFHEGKNVLKAVAYREGQVVARDSMSVNYYYEQPGAPAKVELTSKPLPNGNWLVEAHMTDQKGRRVLNYEERMYFSADGPSRLLVNYGTPTRSQVLEMANGYAAIELQPYPGKTVIEARNQDFKGAYLLLSFSTTDLSQQPKIFSNEE
ncbi:MAG: glycoside hydrolase family 2 TIM barrel-domain containing protein [Phaeodactylibacter sp.]|uniref:glycoside hydrolase family 2 protein n=1 Tax=Phaeodactylibacter sp. TaxID=1940289 RepID=UPI0032EB261D